MFVEYPYILIPGFTSTLIIHHVGGPGLDEYQPSYRTETHLSIKSSTKHQAPSTTAPSTIRKLPGTDPVWLPARPSASRPCLRIPQGRRLSVSAQPRVV